MKLWEGMQGWTLLTEVIPFKRMEDEESVLN
jgi:hypothetical protein